MYKKSNYNFIFKYKEGYLFYNSFTNALSLLDQKEYESYQNMDFSDKDFLKNMKSLGFIHDEKISQLDLIKDHLRNARYANRSLSLTIAPTIDCNFRCEYCYEKDNLKESEMSLENQKILIDFVRQKAKDSKGIYVTWYGGEPLKAIGIIENLTKEFKSIAKENEIIYEAYMVTNGYLLTRKISGKLEDLDIKRIQITIDGDKEFHDKKRILKDKSGTFDVIIKNLKENIDILPEIALRINVDKKNSRSYTNLIDIINDFDKDGKIQPYIAMVRNENGTYTDNLCLNTSEFLDEEEEFFGKNVENPWGLYPSLFNTFCAADSKNAYVINYNLDFYNCRSDMGINELNYGKLTKEGFKANNLKRYYDYMHYDATEDENCKECKYLPICMGGCPYHRLTEKEKECSKYKLKLENYVKKLATYLLEKEESDENTR
ncbi:MAG: radical SAM protein [Helcococcus sp.]|nr:radical SAM protein [Helcococcus sp.]